MKIENKSYWLNVYDNKDLSSLKKNIQVDIAIIGAGLSGLNTALLLAEKNYNVMIFEANEIGHGASGYTTAKITSQHGIIYSKLIQSNNKETARIYANANENAINEIQRIVKQYNIDCDYQITNANLIALDKESKEKLRKEYEACKSLDMDVSFDEKALIELDTHGVLTLKDQGMFHPVKYINSLVQILLNKNIQIYTHTRIVNIDRDNNYVLRTADNQTIKSNTVVIATKYPILNKKALMFTKLHVQRSYVIACKMPNFDIDEYYINIEDKVRSIRPYVVDGEKLILIAGGNHQTGEHEDNIDKYWELINFAKSLDPNVEILHKWSTQDCMTIDNIPYIGQLSQDLPRLYIATGFNKWGLTQSMIAGTIISELIDGNVETWYDIYDIKRNLNIKAISELLKQSGDIAGDLIKSILPVDELIYAELKVEDGKVFEINGDKLGIYKDDNSKIHIVNPKCPHMGCMLAFNKAEKTWDCPCHGSRFTYTGEILESPAVKRIKINEEQK